MRHVRALLPYALAAAGIVAASLVVLGAAAPAHRFAAELPAVVSETPRPRLAVELSPAGRVAYWREAGESEWELWAGDLDGRRRMSLLREPRTVSMSLTRWSPDGSAVAYTRDGRFLIVAGLDGRRATLPVPSDLAAAGWRIGSYEWSPRATKLAVTLRITRSQGPESEMFLVDARPGAAWSRAGAAGGATAGPWLSEDAFLVEIGPGVIALADQSGQILRPITGLPAGSPMLLRDGRVYFHAGLRRTGDQQAGWGGGGLWSITPHGDDLRLESRARFDAARLHGRLADGRFAVETMGSIYLVGEGHGQTPLPWPAGNVRRVVVSDDGRDVIGIGDPRVVRLDAQRIPREPGVPTPADAFRTVLDAARDADVWFARAVTPLPQPPASARGGPPTRLAFILAGLVFEIDRAGVTRPRRLAAPAGSAMVAKWSPTGDRLAVRTTPSPLGGPARWTEIVMLGPDGELWRTRAQGSGSELSWSSDGRRLAVISFGPDGRGQTTLTEILDAATGARLESFERARGRWTARGLVLLVDGDGPSPAERVIEIARDGRRTRLADARTLAAHPGLAPSGVADPLPALWSINPSPDGGLIGVDIGWTLPDRVHRRAFVVIRASDGAVVSIDPLGSRQAGFSLSWSPTAPLVGSTVHLERQGPAVLASPAPSGSGDRAEVRDARDGRVVFEAPGRFAGWTPDGRSVYVTRPDGLFVLALDGGEAVRVSPIGVWVEVGPP